MRSTFTLFLIVTLFIGCSNEARLIRKENKLIGAWEFDKAFYKRDGALFRDNIFNEFAGDIIEFFPNYEAIYDDASARAIFDGWWEIILDEDTYFTEEGSDSDIEFFLDMCFDDFVVNEEFCYFGSICRLSKNRLVIEARDRRGEYTFKLYRL